MVIRFSCLQQDGYVVPSLIIKTNMVITGLQNGLHLILSLLEVFNFQKMGKELSVMDTFIMDEALELCIKVKQLRSKIKS